VRNAALISGLLIVLSGSATHAADLENGKRVAEQWCISCHAPGSPGGAGLASPFAVLVNKYRIEEIVAAWTRNHGSMPKIELRPRQEDNLLAYIQSLKKADERSR